MENYKNVAVNSFIDSFDKDDLNVALKNYLHRRVWDDVCLLEGFGYEDVLEIVNKTFEKYGDEINHFVAVAIENVADDFSK